jgi:two-component system OmpR family response regulator
MCRKVLLIEDSPDIAELMALHLSDLNCEVALATDGSRGLNLAKAGRYNLIVLDLRLPGIDGLDVCRSLRSRRDYTPILMVTAKSSEVDRVVGLEVGADDYLVKPFCIPEFLARAKALLRRLEQYGQRDLPERGVITTGSLVVNMERRTVSVGNEPIELTAKEFDLLVEFVKHPGRVYTRTQLLDLVWGYGHDRYEHTVNCHINRLRAKIEKNQSEPAYILTVHGVGYKFNDALAP